jgi:radical SAM protein with 4Fe4S-binding SPASM domain
MLGVAGDARANSLTFHNLIFLKEELLEKQKEYDKPLGSSSGSWEGFVFDPGINPRELYAKMRQILKGRYSFGVDFYPNLSFKGLEEYYQNPCYMPSEYPARCLSPWIAAYVFPNGDVRPCLNFSYSYGNVRGNKISELWNGPCAIQFRRFLKEKKIFPVCARCTELYRY